MKASQLQIMKTKIAKAMYDNSYSRIKRWEDCSTLFKEFYLHDAEAVLDVIQDDLKELE